MSFTPSPAGLAPRTEPRSRALWIALALLASASPAALAQDVTPGSKPLELPPFQPPERERGDTLPPLQLPDERDAERLEIPEVRAPVREIVVTGDALLPESRVREITRPYDHRALDYSQIAELRDRLTRALIEAGYVTSGAVIPDQSLADGVLEIRIVGGRVSDVRVETDGRLRERYVRSRVDPGDEPIQVGELEQRLQVLQKDARIRTVNAALEPTDRLGESVLAVNVAEAPPWWIFLQGNNYETPAIGSEAGKIQAGWRNVTGWGDAIWTGFTGSEGLRLVEGGYSVPFTRWDTTFEVHGQATWSDVVERPFDDLDIESRTQTYGFTLTQPLCRTLEQHAELFATGEWRQSESFLLGSPFSFVEGPRDGKAELTVARVGGAWSYRTRSQVLALRSQLSVGLPIFGATSNRGRAPDGEFVSWLAQAQLAHRFERLWGTQLIVRGDVQLADRPLLGLEQFAVGGRYTVRGYRENTLVRDNGAVVSAEIRVPLFTSADGLLRIEAGPFVDAGWSWNQDRSTVGPREISSAGAAARVAVTRHLSFEFHWAEDFRDIDVSSDDYNLQDDGLHMALTVEFP